MNTQSKARLRSGFHGAVKIIYWTVFLLMGVQILLGILWMCANLAGFQEYGETAEMLEISATWVLDEYTGAGYPALLWLIQAAAGAVGLAFAPLLYILQTAAAYAAGVFFLSRSGILHRQRQKWGSWVIYYGAAYLVTVPMLLQFHMAVLPYSLAFSSFAVLLGECMGAFRASALPGIRSSCLICGMWVFGSLLLPDYKWLLGIFPVMAFAGLLWKYKKVCYPLILAFIVGTGAVFGTAAITQVPGSRGRIQKTVSAAMLSRFVWPNFARNSYFWNIYVTDVFDEKALLEVSLEPENVIYIFGPGMDRAYGREMAASIYRRMAEVSLEVRTKEAAYEIAGDLLAYLCPQISVQYHLSGKGIAYTGWNYDRMREHAPKLTHLYVAYSLKAWNAAAALASILLLFQKYRSFRRKGLKGLGAVHGANVVLPVAAVLFWSVWYTMSGSGMQDYRNVMPVALLWAVFIIKGWETGAVEDEET